MNVYHLRGPAPYYTNSFVIVTEQGNAVLADQRDVMLEGLGRALGELGDDELETYFAITEKILSSLEEYCEEGGADV